MCECVNLKVTKSDTASIFGVFNPSCLATFQNITYAYIYSESIDPGYLPFLPIEGNAGVKYLPPSDDSASAAINIPLGFPFGNSTHTNVYVSYTEESGYMVVLSLFSFHP